LDLDDGVSRKGTMAVYHLCAGAANGALTPKERPL
jgi:hypothetical protein